MPEPRKPQPNPQHRQPAPQPHPVRPQEKPVPHNPDADKVPGIHVGDAAALANRGTSRPVRPLAPDQQAPPVEFERKIRRGESYWIMGSEELPTPRKGKIVRISNEPGKAIGIEFEEPVGGIDDQGQPWGVSHTCDGRGKVGHCLYVRADQVLDEKAMQIHKARTAEQADVESKFEELEELTVGPDHSQPLTPAMAANVKAMAAPGEHQAIGKDDVGTLSADDLAEGEKSDDDDR